MIQTAVSIDGLSGKASSHPDGNPHILVPSAAGFPAGSRGKFSTQVSSLLTPPSLPCGYSTYSDSERTIQTLGPLIRL